MEKIDVPAGEILAMHPDYERRAFLIAAGRAEIVVDGEPIANVGPGSFVGEMAVPDCGPRCAAVRAQTSMKLIAVEPGDFHARPGNLAVARAVVTRLSEWLGRSTPSQPSISTAASTATPTGTPPTAASRGRQAPAQPG